MLTGTRSLGILLLTLLAHDALTAESPAAIDAWPLWDGNETLEEYAKRVGLEPTVFLRLSEKVALELVLIPAGKFSMGSPETEKDREGEETQHQVTISRPFYIGKYEVTQGQYQWVMGENPSVHEGATLPVDTVSWNDTQEFCRRLRLQTLLRVGPSNHVTKDEVVQIRALVEGLGDSDADNREAAQVQLTRWDLKAFPFLRNELARPACDPEIKAQATRILAKIANPLRLPTEAEWEYACRAGTKTRFYSGNAESDLREAGWYASNSDRKTHPVGEKKPNAWDLFDMHGNVWEWCQDRHAQYPRESVNDPEGVEVGNNRVLRGGSWDGHASRCRSACRSLNPPDRCGDYLGFRVVLSLSRGPLAAAGEDKAAP